jgi:hypothetical protein
MYSTDWRSNTFSLLKDDLKLTISGSCYTYAGQRQ